MAIYITGDTHRDFDRVFDFCDEYRTTKEDVLIILGDAGINYYCDFRDEELISVLAQLEITLFCVHGNHEERPFELGYDEMEWHGGIVYYDDSFPDILFAKDGEIYDFGGKKAIVIGGAYSVDKHYRLNRGLAWFENEQPSDEIKEYVTAQLNGCGWKVDYVFSHTVPIDYEPTWALIPGIDQSTVDKSTEYWLQEIMDNLDFDRWFAGHYHIDSEEGPVRIFFEEVSELDTEIEDTEIEEDFLEELLGCDENYTLDDFFDAYDP